MWNFGSFFYSSENLGVNWTSSSFSELIALYTGEFFKNIGNGTSIESAKASLANNLSNQLSDYYLSNGLNRIKQNSNTWNAATKIVDAVNSVINSLNWA